MRVRARACHSQRGRRVRVRVVNHSLNNIRVRVRARRNTTCYTRIHRVHLVVGGCRAGGGTHRLCVYSKHIRRGCVLVTIHIRALMGQRLYIHSQLSSIYSAEWRTRVRLVERNLLETYGQFQIRRSTNVFIIFERIDL